VESQTKENPRENRNESCDIQCETDSTVEKGKEKDIMKLTRRRFTQALGGFVVALTAPLPPSFPRVVKPPLKVPSAYFHMVITSDLFEDAAFSFEREVMADAYESMWCLDDKYLEDMDPQVWDRINNSDDWTVRVEKFYYRYEDELDGPLRWDGELEYSIRRPAFEAPGTKLRIERPSWWPV